MRGRQFGELRFNPHRSRKTAEQLSKLLNEKFPNDTKEQLLGKNIVCMMFLINGQAVDSFKKRMILRGKFPKFIDMGNSDKGYPIYDLHWEIRRK